ncbi:hypothetical protein K450DRAFT_251040 [Umbelopsis ramanniana AG]|uniref:Uncharacterized protein n=1 Tax=Umbelopsis ramanniana AG TaxID=1314678 RepID=A0AAD5E5A6_UMBRA|nr:uncharacterized protein K450DRAFT_251040 [Umbelopsis ramanniana AG]KAI8577641.1 hypothetical protein K450DRAFT_251040 [Umbelopsis ramanniana AG]
MVAFPAIFLTFAALVLEIFSLIGNTYNKPFLRDLYFARISTSGATYDFGLWNYCVGDGSGTITECSKPVAAFPWSQASGLNNIDGLAGHDKLFMAVFVMYFIATALTFLALAITFLNGFSRGSDLCASFSTFLAFVVMLVTLIMSLVIDLQGIHQVSSAISGASGHLGPATWMTVGATAALLLASGWWLLACCCGSGRVNAYDKEAAGYRRRWW